MKKIILVILIVAILVTGGYFSLKLLGFSFERKDPPISFEQLDMGEFLVNLTDDRRCYLRTQIIIEYIHDKEIEEVFNLQQAKSRDRIITVLRSQSSAELLDVNNLKEVRHLLISELEVALDLEEKIVDLWFVNFVIQ